jgi:hypothetical protein
MKQKTCDIKNKRGYFLRYLKTLCITALYVNSFWGT